MRLTKWGQSRVTALPLLCSIVCSFTGAGSHAQAVGSTCGELRPPGQYGPYDYRTNRDKHALVEGAHFTPTVEALIRGKTAHQPGGDIDYTLRAFPNNPRALVSMMRLGEKEKTPKPSGANFTVACYFERAVAFTPDDVAVRMLYATYLASTSQVPMAVAQLEQATRLAADNPFTHYNIGLVYFDMKLYDKSLAQAHRAMQLGFARPELPELLKAAGHWREPEGEPKSSP